MDAAEIFEAQVRNAIAGERMVHHIRHCGQCGMLPEDPADLCPEGKGIVAEFAHYGWLIALVGARTFDELIRGVSD